MKTKLFKGDFLSYQMLHTEHLSQGFLWPSNLHLTNVNKRTIGIYHSKLI